MVHAHLVLLECSQTNRGLSVNLAPAKIAYVISVTQKQGFVFMDAKMDGITTVTNANRVINLYQIVGNVATTALMDATLQLEYVLANVNSDFTAICARINVANSVMVVVIETTEHASEVVLPVSSEQIVKTHVNHTA